MKRISKLNIIALLHGDFCSSQHYKTSVITCMHYASQTGWEQKNMLLMRSISTANQNYSHNLSPSFQRESLEITHSLSFLIHSASVKLKHLSTAMVKFEAGFLDLIILKHTRFEAGFSTEGRHTSLKPAKKTKNLQVTETPIFMWSWFVN